MGSLLLPSPAAVALAFLLLLLPFFLALVGALALPFLGLPIGLAAQTEVWHSLGWCMVWGTVAILLPPLTATKSSCY